MHKGNIEFIAVIIHLLLYGYMLIINITNLFRDVWFWVRNGPQESTRRGVIKLRALWPKNGDADEKIVSVTFLPFFLFDEINRIILRYSNSATFFISFKLEKIFVLDDSFMAKFVVIFSTLQGNVDQSHFSNYWGTNYHQFGQNGQSEVECEYEND